jgi:hypothetical protein
MHFRFLSEKAKVFIRLIVTTALFIQPVTSISLAQWLPVGTPVLEEAARIQQLKGKIDLNTSFLVRPINKQALLFTDSVFLDTNNFLGNKPLLEKGLIAFNILPVSLRQQYNSHHPFGWNDGSMIPAKGYQGQLSAGLYAKVGPLSIQLQPEFVYAQNAAFSTFPIVHSDSIWRSYYYVLNRIDDPEQFSDKSYLKLFPGQSSIRFNYKKLSLGVSSESLWWGPGVRNSLIMSNHAPGFKHITFNTSAPILTKVGLFEGQVISGILSASNILPPDTSRTFEGQQLYNPKPEGDRYINGMVLTWQPKWTKGLHIGISRVFYQYKANVPSSLNGYLPVVTALFKGKAKKEDAFGRDQLFSLFTRLVLPESRAEVYAEYGRNDHSQNMRDLLLEPEHARAYLLGVKKLFPAKKGKDIELYFELTQLQNPSTSSVRALEGWYTHYQIRHGYTNQGQVIGAGIGPGGSSQTIGLNWLAGINKTGVMFERIVHNNDFYYNAFAPRQEFGRHWVDLAFSLNKSWIQKRFIYAANLSFVRSLNYQWQYNAALVDNVDVTNLHGSFSVSYLLR